MGVAATDLSRKLLRAQATLARQFAKGPVRRVLLVNPPDADAALFRLDTARRKRYTNYPPYGLLLLARALESIGVEARICNLNHEILSAARKLPQGQTFEFDAVWHAALDAAVESVRPDMVGVTCMFTMTHESFKQACARIAARNIPLVIGGVHVSNDVDHVMDEIPGAFAAILGEGENALKRLLGAINHDVPTADLVQLVIADGDDRLRFDGLDRPDESDIDILPAYELVDIGSYSEQGTIGAFYCFKPPETRFATVLSNRGCRAQCTFCSVRNFNGPGVRQRSVESVVDELAYLREHCDVEHIMWLDDDLFKDHRRAIAMFNEMVRRNLNVTWDATNGVIAGSCTEDVIAAAAASGCIALNIGMESGNADILRQVRKPGIVDTFLRAADVLRRFESIHASVFLMVGFPGETMRMVHDTIRVARTMNLDWYRISQLQPLPNTPIFDAMVAQGLIAGADRRETRFNGGAYGKQTEIEQGLRLATEDFAEAFSAIPLDAVPTAEQLTDIWFFMNYHLNFRRIFGESRPEKIAQLTAHLNVLADVISPENGFALYFLGYLQHVSGQAIAPDIRDRLARRLETSPYWRDRFDAFGLTLAQLDDGDFRIGAASVASPSLAPRRSVAF